LTYDLVLAGESWRRRYCWRRVVGAALRHAQQHKAGKVEVVADHYEGKQLHGPNDLTIDGRGRIYFTDQAAGPKRTPQEAGVNAVYRVDPDGTIERILSEPEIERRDGI